MNLNLRLATLTGLLLFVFVNVTFAAKDDYTKTYKEKYDIDKNATLVISNKFGDVVCENWDQNSISINVTVKVTSSSQERAQKVLDKINVQLSGNRNRVEGSTSISNINGNNNEFSIDYNIMLPKWVNIDMTNKFGNLLMDEVEGNSKILVEYGEININALNSSSNDLTIKFTNATIKYIKDASVDIQYGKFNSTGVNKLNLHSRFSGIDVDKVELLKLDSQYDEVKFGEIGSTDGTATGRFSDMEFDAVKGSFDFDVSYGGLKLRDISASFGKGQIENSFCDADLTFEASVAFNLDASLKFGDLDYPSSNASINHVEQGFTTNIYKGIIGKGKNPSASLSIESKNGDVSIDFK